MNAFGLIAAVGMTNIVVDSDMPLVKGFRDLVSVTPLKKLVNCYPCAGFWCGIVCAYLQCPWTSCEYLFLAGCVASLLAALTASLFDLVDVVTNASNSV